MGIRCLTTFVQSRADILMINYELSNTELIIDGNSIICYLYNSFKGRNDSFGGDYDRFGQVVESFFELLFSCKITPYLVFDGGYGEAKIPEIINRMHKRISQIEKLERMNHLDSAQLFPLHMWGTFESIAKKLKVKLVRCAFDCDLECANIGRALNCPVLSNDSDFYLCDILYIPLTTFHLDVHMRASEKYISCKMYRTDCLLRNYKGLDMNKLPLLAVLLGNDNSDPRDADFLYGILARFGSRRLNNRDKVQMALKWLETHSTDSAIEIMTNNRFNEARRRLQKTICHAFKTYTCSDSDYLKYLDKEASSTSKTNDPIIDRYCKHLIAEDDLKVQNVIPDCFMENFKKGLYPSALMDIVSKNRYFCYPQVEDIRAEPAYKPSLRIISAIQKILNTHTEPLVFMGRQEVNRYRDFRELPFEKHVPYLQEIEEMDEQAKQNIMFNILDFEEAAFKLSLENFTKSWHLFILSLRYFETRCHPPRELIYTLILCKLILGHIDQKIGFHRSRDTLHEKYPYIRGKQLSNSAVDIHESLLHMQLEDCVSCLDSVLDFFSWYNYDEQNMGLNRRVIHQMSQFQACLLHLKYLNNLLQNPFEDIFVSESLNSTFIYKTTNHLEFSQDFKQSFESLLRKAPSVLHCLKIIIKGYEVLGRN